MTLIARFKHRVVMAAGKHVLKLSINPLYYQAKAVTFTEKDQEFINRLAKLIKDSEINQVKLCP